MHLKHHGVKNQKWGVRNGPPYPLDESRDTIIKKGTYFYRISSIEKEDTQERGYFSISEDDHNIYLLRSLSLLKKMKNDKYGYSIQYESKNSIRLPGKIKLRKIVGSVIKESSDEDVYDAFYNFRQDKYDKNNRHHEDLVKSIRILYDKKTPGKYDTAHIRMNQMLNNPFKTSKVRDHIFLKLKEEGYGGFFDYFDKNQFSKLPIVLLDRSGLTQKSLTKVTEYKSEEIEKKVKDYLENSPNLKVTLAELLNPNLMK